MKAIQGTCVDQNGTEIIVSIYNFELKGRKVEKLFKKGTVIYVKEPFFKIAMTGVENIRIDNPLDVVFENDPEVTLIKHKKGKKELSKDALIELT